MSEQDIEKISALRICMYDCYPNAPRDLIGGHEPNNHIKYAWIPQTMGDQVWVMYLFESKIDREKWENTLPKNVAKYLDRDLISIALDFGWRTINANGFVVNNQER